MDFLESKLKRTTTAKRLEPFFYSIKRAQEDPGVPSPRLEIVQQTKLPLTLKIEKNNPLSKQENSSVPVSACIDLPPRRKNRYNTIDSSKKHPNLQNLTKPGPFIDLHTPKSSKNCIEIPLDFTNSLSSSLKKGKDDTFSKVCEKYEGHCQTPKFDGVGESPKRFDGICEISASKEMSFHDEIIKTNFHEKHRSDVCRGQLQCWHSSSYDMDKSEGSIIYNSPDRLTQQPKVLQIKSPKPQLPSVQDYSLETEKVDSPNNNNKVECYDIQSIPERNDNIRHHTRDPTSNGTEISLMTFDEALSKFNSLPAVYVEISLWYKDCYYYMTCGLSHKGDMNQESQELCEKVIIFAYSGFTACNVFHARLLVSVFNALQALKEGKGEWVDVGFSSNNPYENDLTHDIAAFGLILILFVDKYIHLFLQEMIEYCLSHDIAFIPLAFDIADIAILALRKRKLNPLINESQKCLEVVFFFYAGCLAQWFLYHKSFNSQHTEVNEIVEKIALSDPKSLINLATKYLQNEM
ncbi:hypothetical protein SteCoe_33052 [Stentor coeruleus]|uniref:ELMO domain-containing protein n=1 Tax=Stentor coeruleus TaxID=5963 RepID=A0A1R2AXT4_9CILI|nr:hypothetical protein SteCoe_33052 [Stentor coeruleus]